MKNVNKPYVNDHQSYYSSTVSSSSRASAQSIRANVNVNVRDMRAYVQLDRNIQKFSRT